MPNPSLLNSVSAEPVALKDLIETTSLRVQQYLQPRPDGDEQIDHLRHVADRTRWLYYSELQHQTPGASLSLTEHENDLLEACVYSHDIGKWVPRDELRQLLPANETDLKPIFRQLKFTSNQADLFLLGIHQRFALERDGYAPEYDSAHHLVSAYMLMADRHLGFHQLEQVDQDRLINMVVGHQFENYFKESLMNSRLRLGSRVVTTGMLRDISRRERLDGDMLGSAFHDADISDLLFVGSLERRPNREPIFHTGGLVKILMINFTNRIYRALGAPHDLHGCVLSCQGTVKAVYEELLTNAARAKGKAWQREAKRFLSTFRGRVIASKLNHLLLVDEHTPADRVVAIRSLLRLHARDFLSRDGE
jgi:hypothetical protein